MKMSDWFVITIILVVLGGIFFNGCGKSSDPAPKEDTATDTEVVSEIITEGKEGHADIKTEVEKKTEEIVGQTKLLIKEEAERAVKEEVDSIVKDTVKKAVDKAIKEAVPKVTKPVVPLVPIPPPVKVKDEADKIMEAISPLLLDEKKEEQGEEKVVGEGKVKEVQEKKLSDEKKSDTKETGKEDGGEVAPLKKEDVPPQALMDIINEAIAFGTEARQDRDYHVVTMIDKGYMILKSVKK